jgi:RNA polymerase sigma-70 factor (ECF subfamily)
MNHEDQEAERRRVLERDIRRRVDAGDLAGATTVALRGYGPSILRFLLALHGGEAAASDVFSLFAEGVWRNIGAFDWQCTFRTWAFAVARRASLCYRRDEGRRAKRQLPLGDDSALSAIEDQIRTETLSYLKTERRSRFAEIRDALPPDERALLILRIEQGLAWNDLAQAMHDGEGELAGEALKREAARLRKRFQILKEKLLAIGRREGLMGTGKEDER